MAQGMAAASDRADFAPSVALATVAALLDGDSSEQFSVSLARLLPKLGRHLEDEEDLIIPLILERGEHQLGVA